MEQDEAPVLSTPIPFHFLPAFLGNKGASGSRGPSSRPHFSPVMWNGPGYCLRWGRGEAGPRPPQA